MEPTTTPGADAFAGAPVISLADRRRALRGKARRPRIAHVLVAVWFGTALTAAAALVSAGLQLALRHGLIGIGIVVLIGAGLAWPLAGRWLRPKDVEAERSEARQRHPAGKGLR